MGAASAQAATTPTPPSRSLPSRMPLWLITFSIVATAGLLQFASVDWNRPLSVYDEVPHIDYTIRLAAGEITTWDDVYSQRTLGIAECLELQSPDPQCIAGEFRDLKARWPNGHSYEAHQAPLGYMPFVLAELTFVDKAENHFSQIKRLRLVNVMLWVVFAAMWGILVLQATSHRLGAAAASVVVGVNPLVVDRFTYVTNDSMAIIVAAAATAWLLFYLRQTRPRSSWLWVIPSVLLGAGMGLTKPTALIVLIPLVVAVFVSHVMANRQRAPGTWWLAVVVMIVSGVTSSLLYQAFIDARSTLDFETVLSTMLPRDSLGLMDASFIRIVDVAELVTGSGARTSSVAFEWGVRWPSIFVLLFALSGAAAFLVSLSLRSDGLDLLPRLDSRVLSYSVLLALVLMLIAHPALHYIRGEFLMPFTAGRFQSTLVPIAALATVSTFQRFRLWALITLPAGLAVSLMSGSWGQVLENWQIVLTTLQV